MSSKSIRHLCTNHSIHCFIFLFVWYILKFCGDIKSDIKSFSISSGSTDVPKMSNYFLKYTFTYKNMYILLDKFEDLRLFKLKVKVQHFLSGHLPNQCYFQAIHLWLYWILSSFSKKTDNNVLTSFFYWLFSCSTFRHVINSSEDQLIKVFVHYQIWLKRNYTLFRNGKRFIN